MLISPVTAWILMVVPYEGAAYPSGLDFKDKDSCNVARERARVELNRRTSSTHYNCTPYQQQVQLVEIPIGQLEVGDIAIIGGLITYVEKKTTNQAGYFRLNDQGALLQPTSKIWVYR